MKAIFVSCNQALYTEVLDKMKELGIRGYTGWEELEGCGTSTGDPHLGTGAWPTLNSALIAMVEDAKAEVFLAELREIDNANPKLGLHAFWWQIGGSF